MPPQPQDAPAAPTREMLFLAEQAVEGKLSVLPSKEWSLHYPSGSSVRSQKLQALLDGTASAPDVARDITPDALLYNVDDIGARGLEAVAARIRDLSATITYYDYPRFARFVERLRGRTIPIEELDALYSAVARTRIQKKLMDAYGATGRAQIERALKDESARVLEHIPTLPPPQKILSSLKLQWLCGQRGMVSTQARDQAVSALSGDERALFHAMEGSYRGYVERGDEQAYEAMVDRIAQGFPQISAPEPSDTISQSMEELDKALEPFKDQVGPPGTPKDPAIVPDDADEYHTPPPTEATAEGKERAGTLFEIRPPLAGYYATGRKSYYDIETKTWSKKKKLTAYRESISGGADRHTISGTLEPGLKALPIPVGYAVDAGSFTSTGSTPELLRDQNGCFYIQTTAPTSFSIDFLPEPYPYVGPPVPEDTAPLYRGKLSSQTEAAIGRLNGTATQKAEQARQYIAANHFYPAGGLKAAQALQYKLRSESTGDTYLQNVDVSEYLECYSSHNKDIAMLRASGAPIRMVHGHKIDGAQDGKTVIDETTGHAWAEVWDGTVWRRVDATPKPKPEDKKPDDKKREEEGKKDPAPEAQDGGIDAPQPSTQQSPAGGKPMEQMAESSDSAFQEAQQEIEGARQQLEEFKEQKQQLSQNIQEAKTFTDLAKAQKELTKSELFDDWKKDLEQQAQAKQQEMKEALTQTIEKMTDDGFMDEARRDALEQMLKEKPIQELDRLQENIKKEQTLYDAYEQIREEVMPLVDKWFRYFAERLPRQDEPDVDEDSLTRQGAFNRHSIMKARNLLFGLVRNPRVIKPSIKPRFLASILLDVSGSMEGKKLHNARKLLVFYCELFSRISQTFGYIQFSANIFSDTVTPIKTFDQQYESRQRYEFDDGESSTVKVRLMKQLLAKGGTNMLDALRTIGEELNKQVAQYPEYASALYFVGDGEDTCNNGENIRKFLAASEAQKGFGQHLYCATLLGTPAQRKTLADIFGDDHTRVAPEFETLIEESMNSFEDDLEAYLSTKITLSRP